MTNIDKRVVYISCGDYMKIKKMITPVLLALLTGFIMGNFMFKEYGIDNVTLPVLKSADMRTLSFLQVGVYNTLDSMKKNLEGLENYIYVIEDNKYHAYVAITANADNVDKLTGFYQEMGYITYVKSIASSDTEFLNELDKYDELLSKTSDLNAIRVINQNILTSYKELVIDDSQNEGNPGK